ncbi:hypothetical protein CLV47_102284 [Antricoccus suffuscus]|uniref:Uncharacterized protein n=1 Tax=Antricoccus suffuscus TaxID=1629062 RepID=A0A2T1A4W7_9ACTN|nr:hypothetical protein CLV47_102284 [Antricoccus suffuscus]
MTAFVVVTKPFLPLVKAQAKSRGVEPKLIVVGHPIGGLNETELQERITEGIEGFLSEFARVREEGNRG